MTSFTIQQWIIVGLVFLLGLVLGMYMLAGGRWKRRYQQEHERSEALEAENARLRSEAREMESLRHAAAKAPPPSERAPL
jgi:type II secretory pathway component PulM